MIVKAYKTNKVKAGDNLFKILDKYLPKLEEKEVVAISSKVVATCEGRVVKIGTVDKDDLIFKESQFFLPRDKNPYNVSLTITRSILAASAGIDESNGNGNYILWPKDPQASANSIREYLCKKFNRKYIGVILTDSKTTPMRWGVTGIALAYSGFLGVKSLIGKKDLFGKKLEYTTVSVMDSLASAAILEMGESNDQKPLAVISDISVAQFVDHNPTQKELDKFKISLEEDLYGEFLKNAPWEKGNKK